MQRSCWAASSISHNVSVKFFLAALGWLGIAYAQNATGGELYARYCAHCHGVTGEGARGPALARTRLYRANTEELFLKIVQQGIADTEMPGSRLQDREVRLIRAYLQTLAAAQREAPRGDAARGARLFREKGGCLKCHMVKGEGGRLGPELSMIGLSRSRARLRAAMVDPGAETPNQFAQYRLVIPMPDNFLMVQLRTREGKEITGVRLNEDPFTIQVRGSDDRLHSFQKRDLARVEKLPGKTMMPSYQGKFNETELDDVVAYLLSLRGE